MPSGTLTGWSPNATSRMAARVAKAAGVDIEAEHEKFLAYPRDEPLHDPDKAFQAWLERAAGFHAKRKANEPSEKEAQRATELERKLAAIEAYRFESPVGYRRLERYMAQHRWWDRCTRSEQVEQMRQAIEQRDLIFAYLDSQGREF